MRYIDWLSMELPDEWLKKAEEATDSIESCGSLAERKQYLENNGSVWRDATLKDIMEALSYEKCWYCEAIQDRSDYAVDHFRPKGKVAKEKTHHGYWWLAYDWTNYRCSCTWCNSRRRDRKRGKTGGKQDEFPLLPQSPRATETNRDTSVERPMLLDPTCKEDVNLLWFYQDGNAVPKFSEEEDKESFLRADKSIDLYHLNYHKTKKRRLKLYQRIEKLVKNGDKCLDTLELDEDDEMALLWFGDIVNELQQILQPSSEFSAAARAFVLGLREPDREWLDIVLEADYE